MASKKVKYNKKIIYKKKSSLLCTASEKVKYNKTVIDFFRRRYAWCRKKLNIIKNL